MAIKIGIMGSPNTGKSFSRSFLTEPENTVVLSSSAKATYLKGKDGKPLLKFPAGPALKAAIDNKEHIPGNWTIVPDIAALGKYMTLVSNNMPHIKTIIIPDFTHYISRILASDKFMQRNAGGGAFARFWELAADSLNTFFMGADNLRDDLVIVIEFHSEFNEIEQHFQIYVPGGKMLSEKFKPESYFDFMFCTHIEIQEDDSINANSYKFVTRKHRFYNARSMELFESTMISNNLQNVLNEVRNYFQI